MKSAARAAVAALVTIAASVAALLSFAGPALASATPPSPNPALSGTWANTNTATRNVADIVVTRKAGGLQVDGFGACSPRRREWGKIPGTVFGANVSSVTGNSFKAS